MWLSPWAQHNARQRVENRRSGALSSRSPRRTHRLFGLCLSQPLSRFCVVQLFRGPVPLNASKPRQPRSTPARQFVGFGGTAFVSGVVNVVAVSVDGSNLRVATFSGGMARITRGSVKEWFTEHLRSEKEKPDKEPAAEDRRADHIAKHLARPHSAK